MSFKEWREICLDDISDMKYGKMPEKNKKRETGYPIYSGYRIVGYYEEYMFEEPKLLVVARGVGGTGDVKISPPKSYITNLSIILLLDEKQIDKKYLYHKLRNENLKLLDSGTAQSQITISDLKRYKITIPPLNEQKTIANILSILDEKIELNNQMNQTLEEIVQAIYKNWFVDFEFPNKNGKPYKLNKGKLKYNEKLDRKIPINFEVSKIGDELKTELGGTPLRREDSFWDNGEIPWIKSGEVNNFRIIKPTEYITKKGLENSSTVLLPKRTVVIAITGATLGQISLLEIDTCANQSVVGILESNSIPSEYIYLYIKNEIDNLIAKQTGGAQQHINKTNVNNTDLMIPNKKVLGEFVNLVRPIFNKISKNCFENKTLTKLRDTLLPKLMSGEIRVEPDAKKNVGG